MPETKEELEQKPEVRKELARAGGEKKPGEKVKARGTDKFWFVTHGLLLIGCAVLYYLVESKFVPLSPPQVDLAHRIIRGVALVVLVLAIAKAISVYALRRIDDASTRFTLSARRASNHGAHYRACCRIRSLRQLVPRIGCARCRIDHHWSCRADADEKLHRLDLHSRSPTISRR